MRRLVPALAAALLLTPAKGALRLCNSTSYVLYAATGAGSKKDVAVKGWTRVVPGACQIAIKGDLTARNYYLYARSSPAHAGEPRAWSGKTALCVRDNNFSLTMPRGRCKNGYALPFATLDTHHMRSWTATLRQSPDLGSMKKARNAGLKRLLGDIGVRDISGGKAMHAALAAFRRRMHLPPGAGDGALFDALETEAMTRANPAGLTICNDTDKPAWAALGLQTGKVFTSRGWWDLTAGSCARALARSVANRKIYLHVERAKGPPLVSGPEKFCITNTAFDVQGRGGCVKRGLTEAGFAAVGGGRAAGVTAHVTDKGLVRR